MPSGLIKVKRYKGVYYRESTKNRYRGKPDVCYYITYRDKAAKFVREKVGWASEGYNAVQADTVRIERLRDIRHGKIIPPKHQNELTFGDAWDHYDNWLDTGKKHPYDDRNRYDNHIKNRFSKKGLSRISTHELEKFKASLLNKGLAPATVKHILVLVRQVYNKMIAWKLWTGVSPTKGLDMPKVNNKRVRFLTREEAHKLLDEVKSRSQQMYEIALLSLHTGMRADEVHSLLWGHLDFERDIIHVADPKGGKARDSYMTKTIKTILSSKEEGEPGELVFKNRSGKKIGEVSKTFLRSVNELKLNDGIEDRRQQVSFHTLRHTFASWLAIQGTQILEIKELLGHSTLAMAERYSHLSPDQKRLSVERMIKVHEDVIKEDSD